MTPFAFLPSSHKPGTLGRSNLPWLPMNTNVRSARARSMLPRIRILHGRNIALGPGKVELLALIGQTGSINRAARQIDMSYMRAWSLVRTMNRCFRKPLVRVARGGEGGGGAALTETGAKVVTLYQQMEDATLRASAASWRQLRRLLRS